MPQKRQVHEVFDRAVEIDHESERQEYLTIACAGDSELRQEVDRLLEAYEQADDLLADRGAFINSAHELETIGTTIGSYKLREQIGSGGMGDVYVAEQFRPVTRTVALKIIKPGMDTKQVIARFEVERQTLAMMDHPNIARVLDAGNTESGRPYFVMDLVRGVPITEYCDKHKLSTRLRLDLFTTVCHAVQYAHQKGIIHRDIKPGNVLVTRNGDRAVPKVIDFGVAKATNRRLTEQTIYTQFNQMIGTPLYMSPEQAEMCELDIDTRSDVYSLGVMLYELLTGSTPVERKQLSTASFDEIRRIIRDEEPIRPSQRISTLTAQDLSTISTLRSCEPRQLNSILRGELDWIVMKAMEKDRSLRYGTATDLADDIQRHLGNLPIEAGPRSTIYELRRFVRRNRRPLVVATAIGIALFVSTVFSAWQAVRAFNSVAAADLAAKEAESNFYRAEAAEKRAKLQSEARLANLVQAHVATGARLMNDDDYATASLYFAEALRLDQGDTKRQRLHRIRCASTIQACVKPVAIWDSQMRASRMAVSRDGNLVLTFNGFGVYWGDQGESRIWDASTGKLVATLPHDKDVHDAAFSPDGKYVATASADKTARLWDSTSGEPAGPKLGHELSVLRVRFNAAGDRLATVTGSMSPMSEEYPLRDQSTAIVWSVPTGEQIFSVRHTDYVRDVSFSPDDKLIATVSADGTARLWNANTGLAVGDFLEHATVDNGRPAHLWEVRFSSDGTRLMTTSNMRPPSRCWMWNVSTREQAGGPFLGQLLDATPDGSRLLTHSSINGSVFLWQMEDRIATRVDSKGDCHVGRFSPNGDYFFTAGRDGCSAKIWVTATGNLASGPLFHAGRVWAAEFIRGGRALITLDGDGWLRAWDLASAQTKSHILRHAPNLYANAFSPSVSLASVSTNDAVDHGTIHIMDLKSGKLLGQSLHRNKGDKTVFNPDETRLLVYGQKTPRIWNFESSDVVTVQAEEDQQHVRHAVFGPGGRLIATAHENGIAQIWDAATGATTTKPLQHSSAVSHVAFSLDGQQLVTCVAPRNPGIAPNARGEARAWNTRTGDPLTPLLPHEAPVVWAEFSPDGERIVTATAHRNPAKCSVQVWSIASGKRVGILQHREPVGRVGFLSAERLVISSSRSGTARVWDANSLLPVTSPMSTEGRGSGLLCIRDDVLLVAGGQAQIWETATGQPVSVPINYSLRPLILSPGGTTLVGATRSGIQVWPIVADNRSVDELISIAEVLSGHRLESRGGLIPLSSTELYARFQSLNRAMWP